MNPRVMTWCGAIVALLAVAGLVAYFAAVGLGKANELAGVFGVFTGIAGLAVSVWGVLVARRGAGPEPGQAPSSPQASSINQSVTGATGPVFQVGSVDGDLDISN